MQAKPKSSYFDQRVKILLKIVTLEISRQKINLVKQTKYLCIYLDKHLTWNFQTNQIKSKLNRICVFFEKLRYYLKTVCSELSILQFLAQF